MYHISEGGYNASFPRVAHGTLLNAVGLTRTQDLCDGLQYVDAFLWFQVRTDIQDQFGGKTGGGIDRLGS